MSSVPLLPRRPAGHAAKTPWAGISAARTVKGYFAYLASRFRVSAYDLSMLFNVREVEVLRDHPWLPLLSAACAVEEAAKTPLLHRSWSRAQILELETLLWWATLGGGDLAAPNAREAAAAWLDEGPPLPGKRLKRLPHGYTLVEVTQGARVELRRVGRAWDPARPTVVHVIRDRSGRSVATLEGTPADSASVPADVQRAAWDVMTHGDTARIPEELLTDQEWLNRLARGEGGYVSTPFRDSVRAWFPGAYPGHVWSLVLDGPFLHATLSLTDDRAREAIRHLWVDQNSERVGGRHARRAWRALLADPTYKKLPKVVFAARYYARGPLPEVSPSDYSREPRTALKALAEQVYDRVARTKVAADMRAVVRCRERLKKLLKGDSYE